MEYVIQEGKLDNRVHDISYEQLRLLYEDNLKEAEESERITQSSYRGENYYGKYDNFHYELQQEYLVRDPRTSGMRIYYPHGVIINQAARRNYYRGENRIYEESVPSLHRTLKKYTTVEEKELYRISNSLINNDKYTEEEIENFCKKLAKIEANKFCDRFLHGSWSVGNISTEGNLIDFDTSSFVKGRFPQYSNTNKYKSNYFGYELLGQKIMINSISNNEKLEKIMNDEYEKNIKIKFCDLIGLDYNLYYLKYYKYIDSLSKKFNILSRKFLANYYDTNIANQNENITYLFDFSRFFQKYLIYREKGNKFINGIKLLFNDPQYIEYEKVGMIKEKVEKFFEKDIVNDDNMDKYINEAMDFIQEYDELFEKIEKEQDLQEIKLKQYFINADRNYLYSKEHIFGKIAYKYDIKEIDDKTINIIINSLIKANIRNHYNIECKNILGLRLYKDFLTYWIVTKNYYYLVIEPFSNFDIEFAKLSLNGEEFMIKHRLDEEGAMESEKIEFDSLPDILNFDVKIKINGKEYNGEFDQI